MTMSMQRHDIADPAPRQMALLGISERGGRDESPQIDGDVPREINGSLRAGPGNLDRGIGGVSA